ncbi:hypothetical protein [Streptomyces sp. NBC_00474]|uniref:hypothetical protein n=1 Tax=Streptomyces sp. NBC_00474 TaxID=2975754 RepID=UPI002251C6D4|nr:hypothetical protein [Streptomyces sp. NBC_00474]MCX5050525.1 hypothetical protein [Streptomyces sp. NBC_00474]
MTWPAALPGAALRVMRTAAGRRALQVVVLVGGLLALGFLCGEQAHAAEEVPAAVTSSEVAPAASADGVGSLTSGAATTATTVTTAGRLADTAAGPEVRSAPLATEPKPHTPAEPFPDTPAQPKPASTTSPIPTSTTAASLTSTSTSNSARSPAEPSVQLVKSVADGVERPVGGLAEAVHAGLGEVTAQIPPLSSLPALPGAPSLPSLPSLRSLARFPAQPGRILPVPFTHVPQSGAAGSVTEGAVDDRRSAAAGASGTAFGPRLTVGVSAAGATAHGDRQRAAGAGHAPARQAPDGDPTGALGNQSAVNNGASRHGDAHAVALNHRAPLRLVPGAAAHADAAGTPDRHRDIPVFPG